MPNTPVTQVVVNTLFMLPVGLVYSTDGDRPERFVPGRLRSGSVPERFVPERAPFSIGSVHVRVPCLIGTPDTPKDLIGQGNMVEGCVLGAAT